MTTTLSPKLIGQTEKTLNAILQRIVGDRVSEPEWVALVVLSGAADDQRAGDATAIVAGALKLEPEQAAGIVSSLGLRGLLETSADGAARITTAGRELLGEVRSRTEQVTQRLWGDLPADELAVAANVLTAVLERAERELAAA